MPERKPAPAVRLKADLPDGNRNGLASVAEHFLVGREHVLAVVRLGRKQVIHDDDADSDLPVLRIVAVAAPAHEDDQQLLSRLLTDTLAEQFGGGQPIPEPEGPAADRGRYERALAAWQKTKKLSDAQVAAEWKDYFGAAVVPGPLGAELPHLVEFVLERAGGLPDELPEGDS